MATTGTPSSLMTSLLMNIFEKHLHLLCWGYVLGILLGCPPQMLFPIISNPNNYYRSILFYAVMNDLKYLNEVMFSNKKNHKKIKLKKSNSSS